MRSEDFAPDAVRRTAFFTGHRLLNTAEKQLIEMRVRQCISSAYDAGYRRFFCGCALGFDTLAAFQTISLRENHPDMILSLAIPCPSQPERWKDDDQSNYNRILDLADEKLILSPAYYNGVMLARNRYMADRSSLCICYMKYLHGGTASAVRYALVHGGIDIINLAVSNDYRTDQMRELSWNCMFISPSAGKNAVTVPLHLSRSRKLIMKNTRI